MNEVILRDISMRLRGQRPIWTLTRVLSTTEGALKDFTNDLLKANKNKMMNEINEDTRTHLPKNQ